MQDTKPILVLQTAFLGDVILSIPLLKRLRLKKPRAPIYLIVRKGLGHFLKELGLIDFYFEIEKGNTETYSQLAKKLASVDFDWLVCPHPSLRSALLVNSLKAKVKMAYRDWWNSFFFTDRTEKQNDWPEALRQLSLIKCVDLELFNLLRNPNLSELNNSSNEGMLPEIPKWAELSCREKIVSWPDPFLLKAPYICIFPGSVWPTKMWTQEGFRQLGLLWIARGYEVLWMGGGDEIALARELEQSVPGSRSFCGKTSITHSLSLLSRAALAVSNDSGGQHLAAVAGTPVVGIFGPTVPEMGFRPWTSKAAIAEYKGLSCRPCGRHGHKKCPIGTHDCMKGVSAETVLQLGLKIIKSPLS